jgi:hypothetical protein
VAASKIRDEEQRRRAISDCHVWGARQLLDLCFANGGIYIKLGQHVGQLVRAARRARRGTRGPVWQFQFKLNAGPRSRNVLMRMSGKVHGKYERIEYM